jgi:hypothetical protein
MSAVIRTIDEATPERLTALLRQGGALPTGRVLEVRRRRSPTRNSSSYHLRLRYSDDAPITSPTRVFLKLSLEPGWGEAEVAFYRAAAGLQPELPMLVGVIDAAIDADQNSHLLLHDRSATHLTPVTKRQLLAGVTMPTGRQLDLMIDAIAEFHARWWEDPGLGSGFATFRRSLDGPSRFRDHVAQRRSQWSEFDARSGALIGDDLRNLYARALEELEGLWDHELAERFGRRRAITLSHGDCYFIQFLCPRPGVDDRAYLIDFDSVSANLPAYDLVYMLATFWTREQRTEKRREERLLQRYLRGLEANGVTGYGWEDLLADYRTCLLLMVFDPVWDETSGASVDYWLPKLRCLTGALIDFGV